MTAKEKANVLGNKFYKGSVFDYDKQGHMDECKRAKEIALICVDEIIESLWNVGHSSSNDEINYWKEVKEEINKL